MHDLERFIPIGKENAIHQDILAERLGVSTSKVKRLIKKARLDGVVICGDSQGYYIAGNRDETKAFYYSMRKQAISRLKSIRLIRIKLKEIEGQISLFDNVEGVKGE